MNVSSIGFSNLQKHIETQMVHKLILNTLRDNINLYKYIGIF